MHSLTRRMRGRYVRKTLLPGCRAFAAFLGSHRTSEDATQQFPTERQRHDYLTARVLCRATLSRYAPVHPSEWKFEKGAYGKPRIAAPAGFESLHFNLTHTEGLMIFLVSRAGEVGIDAEKTIAKHRRCANRTAFLLTSRASAVRQSSHRSTAGMVFRAMGC